MALAILHNTSWIGGCGAQLNSAQHSTAAGQHICIYDISDSSYGLKTLFHTYTHAENYPVLVACFW